jgi:hypothetical protein
MNPASSISTLPPPSSPQSADLAALASATLSSAPVKLSSAVPVSKTAAAPARLPSAAPVKLSSAVPVSTIAAVPAPLPSAAPVKMSSAVPVSKTAAAPAPLPSAALSAVPVRRTSAEHAVLTSAVPSKEKPEAPTEALSGSVPQLDGNPSEARALGRQVSMGSNTIDEWQMHLHVGIPTTFVM